ncbi:hypothetical protein, partial [Streptomyces sp. NPDC057257]|uniref:hypothetical protein n=1 Tax=Streptomyces sp. NPDC057257 TaxID=3346071 RepID=UPI003644373B
GGRRFLGPSARPPHPPTPRGSPRAMSTRAHADGHGMGSMGSSSSMSSMSSMSSNSSMSSMDMSDVDSMQSMSDMGSMPMGGSVHLGHTADGTASLGMLAAHLLAALLCGLWLAYGERAAFRILRAVAGWLAAPLRLLLALPVPPHRPCPRPRRRASDREPRLLLLVHAITTRGPPVGTAVA